MLIRARAALAIAILAAVVATGCAAPALDPASPCTRDGRAPSAYPELEALVPRDLGSQPPTRVDSGRNCTPASLGSLAAHGVREIQFAGATWETGTSSGVSSAVFRSPGEPELTAEWVHEFYRAGAEAARDAETVEASRPVVNGHPAYRVDALNGDSYQTVIDWEDGDVVRVVLVSSFVREVDTKAEHEATVTAALEAVAALQAPAPSP